MAADRVTLGLSAGTSQHHGATQQTQNIAIERKELVHTTTTGADLAGVSAAPSVVPQQTAGAAVERDVALDPVLRPHATGTASVHDGPTQQTQNIAVEIGDVVHSNTTGADLSGSSVAPGEVTQQTSGILAQQTSGEEGSLNIFADEAPATPPPSANPPMPTEDLPAAPPEDAIPVKGVVRSLAQPPPAAETRSSPAAGRPAPKRMDSWVSLDGPKSSPTAGGSTSGGLSLRDRLKSRAEQKKQEKKSGTGTGTAAAAGAEAEA